MKVQQVFKIIALFVIITRVNGLIGFDDDFSVHRKVIIPFQ